MGRIWKVNSSFIVREVGGITVMVPTGQTAASFNKVVFINETANQLIKLIEQGKNEEELILGLQTLYKVSENIAKNHVMDFVNGMETLGVLEKG